MKITELAQGIGKQLAELFPDRLMFVDRIPAEADGQFFLNVVEVRDDVGISSRRTRSATLDLLYFSRADDRIAYFEWAEKLCEGFRTVKAGEQLLHTRARRTHAEEMVYHFIFEIGAEYVEFEETQTMARLEVAIEKA